MSNLDKIREMEKRAEPIVDEGLSKLEAYRYSGRVIVGLILLALVAAALVRWL